MELIVFIIFLTYFYWLSFKVFKNLSENKNSKELFSKILKTAGKLAIWLLFLFLLKEIIFLGLVKINSYQVIPAIKRSFIAWDIVIVISIILVFIIFMPFFLFGASLSKQYYQRFLLIVLTTFILTIYFYDMVVFYQKIFPVIADYCFPWSKLNFVCKVLGLFVGLIKGLEWILIVLYFLMWNILAYFVWVKTGFKRFSKYLITISIAELVVYFFIWLIDRYIYTIPEELIIVLNVFSLFFLVIWVLWPGYFLFKRREKN